MIKKTVLSMVFALATSPALALYSTMDTGEVLGDGKMEVTGETQFVMDGDSGMNLIARFDRGFNDDSQIRGLIGVGTTDIHIGAFYKWIPIPDYEDQPAIGLIGGVIYAKHQGSNELSVRLTPIISKKVDIEDTGMITPYASLPMGVRSFKEKNEVPIQLAIGSRFQPIQFNKVHFYGELGFDVRQAFTYLSIGLAMDFDEENGLSWE